MSKILAISSGKGGVGKTTVTANLGIALGRMGVKTAAVDLDLGLRNLDVVLGLETQVFNHLGDLLLGSCTAEDALISDTEKYPSLSLLPAPQLMEPGMLTKESLKRVLDGLKEKFDVILLDCPAGIGEVLKLAFDLADEGIAVTVPTVSAVRDADKILHIMEEKGIRQRYVLVNAIRPELVSRGIMMEPEDIADVMGVTLLGAVPEDDEVIVCTNEGKNLITSGSPAGKAFERIARRLRGEALPIPHFKRKRRGLFGRRK